MKKTTMDADATIATEAAHLAKPQEFVRRVWRGMRKGDHEVGLCIRSNPASPDYAVYKALEATEDGVTPWVLAAIRSGRTHNAVPEGRWNAAEDFSSARMNWDEVRDLYAELVKPPLASA